MVKIHILGCGDAFGSGGRNQSGYLVEGSNRLFLLDCGPTTLLAMKRAGFDPKRLDVIFLSHLHGDHFGGIPFFFMEYMFEAPRDKPLHIAGPPCTQDRSLDLLRLMYGGASGANKLPPARFHVLRPERTKTVANIKVFPFRVPHQVREISLGLKITYEGKRILFSGDSAWTEQFLTHARGVDLFLCECCFYNHETTNHMNYLKLQEKLPQLECKKLILTHLGQQMLARKEELPVTLAHDGMVIEI